MKERSVAHILNSEIIKMGGTVVKQPLPTIRVDQISPFLLLHHFGPTQVDPGYDPLDVAAHPHRGFEPVTFLFSGGIRHKDSRGNEGVLKGGDVQWMTAGRGIIHSERASGEFLNDGGVMEGIQLWVNLPKEHKLTQPKYQDIKGEDIPLIREDDGKVELALVAGNFQEQQGPAATFTPILALMSDLKKGGSVAIPVPDSFNMMIYVLNGEVALKSGFSYGKETLINFKNDGEGVLLTAKDDSKLVILAGEPINEPVAQWGPYVMNTQTEVMEAMRDFQMGKMGFYVD